MLFWHYASSRPSYSTSGTTALGAFVRGADADNASDTARHAQRLLLLCTTALTALVTLALAASLAVAGSDARTPLHWRNSDAAGTVILRVVPVIAEAAALAARWAFLLRQGDAASRWHSVPPGWLAAVWALGAVGTGVMDVQACRGSVCAGTWSALAWGRIVGEGALALWNGFQAAVWWRRRGMDGGKMALEEREEGVAS